MTRAEGPAFITSLTQFTFLTQSVTCWMCLRFCHLASPSQSAVKENHFLISGSPNLRDSVPLLSHVSRLPQDAVLVCEGGL